MAKKKKVVPRTIEVKSKQSRHADRQAKAKKLATKLRSEKANRFKYKAALQKEAASARMGNKQKANRMDPTKKTGAASKSIYKSKLAGVGKLLTNPRELGFKRQQHGRRENYLAVVGDKYGKKKVKPPAAAEEKKEEEKDFKAIAKEKREKAAKNKREREMREAVAGGLAARVYDRNQELVEDQQVILREKWQRTEITPISSTEKEVLSFAKHRAAIEHKRQIVPLVVFVAGIFAEPVELWYQPRQHTSEICSIKFKSDCTGVSLEKDDGIGYLFFHDHTAGLFSDLKDGLDEVGDKWKESTQLCKPGDASCIEESVFSDAACKQKIMGPFFWPVPQTQATSKCVPIKMTGRYNSAWLENGQLVGKSECADTACTTDCRETYRTGLDDDACLGPFDAGKGAYYLKIGQSKEKRDWKGRDWKDGWAKDKKDHHDRDHDRHDRDHDRHDRDHDRHDRDHDRHDRDHDRHDRDHDRHDHDRWGKKDAKDNKCLEDKGRGMQPDDDCCAMKGKASCADGYTLVESEETCCSWCAWKPLKYSCVAPNNSTDHHDHDHDHHDRDHDRHDHDRHDRDHDRHDHDHDRHDHDHDHDRWDHHDRWGKDKKDAQLCKPGDASCIEESVFSDAACKQKIMGPFFWPVPQTQATSKCVPIKMTGRYNSAWLENGQLVGKSECADTACTTDCRETYRTGLDDDACLGPFDAGKGAYYLKIGQSKEKRDWKGRDWKDGWAKDKKDHHDRDHDRHDRDHDRHDRDHDRHDRDHDRHDRDHDRHDRDHDRHDHDRWGKKDAKDNKCLEDKGRGMQPDDDCCAMKGKASCADGYTLVESEETCCSWCFIWKPLKYSCVAPSDTLATLPPTAAPTAALSKDADADENGCYDKGENGYWCPDGKGGWGGWVEKKSGKTWSEDEKKNADADENGCYDKGEDGYWCPDGKGGWVEKEKDADARSWADQAAAMASQEASMKQERIAMHKEQGEASEDSTSSTDSTVTAVVAGAAALVVAALAAALVVYRRRLAAMQTRLDYEMNDARNLATPNLSSGPGWAVSQGVREAMAMSSSSAPLGALQQAQAMGAPPMGKPVEL
eukprot:g279.t1